MAPPSRFAALLDLDSRAQVLEELQKWWENLEALEKASHNDTNAKDFLANLVWPRWIWVREVFITLSEHNWDIPGHLLRDIEDFASAWTTQKVCEGSSRVLRARSRSNSGAALSRKSRWAVAQHSSLMHEYGYAQITPTNDAKAAATGVEISNTLFSAAQGAAGQHH